MKTYQVRLTEAAYAKTRKLALKEAGKNGRINIGSTASKLIMRK
jgi:hypothetical protein